jgi:hypothetical protein
MRVLVAMIGVLLLGVACGQKPAVSPGSRGASDGPPVSVDAAGDAKNLPGAEVGTDAPAPDAPGLVTLDAAAMDASSSSADGLRSCNTPSDCSNGMLCCVDCQGGRACNAACTGEVCPQDAGTDAGFACGTARCGASQICVQACTCGGAFLCVDKGDAATCPGGPCPGDPTRCAPVCNNPPPRCVDLPPACNGTPSNACLAGNPCPGQLISDRRYLCNCPP